MADFLFGEGGWFKIYNYMEILYYNFLLGGIFLFFRGNMSAPFP